MKDDETFLSRFAWQLATAPGLPKRDLKLAMRLATRAAEVSRREDAIILDTLARVHFESGEVDKAIEVETEALAKAAPELREEMDKVLAGYKAAKK